MTTAAPSAFPRSPTSRSSSSAGSRCAPSSRPRSEDLDEQLPLDVPVMINGDAPQGRWHRLHRPGASAAARRPRRGRRARRDRRRCRRRGRERRRVGDAPRRRARGRAARSRVDPTLAAGPIAALEVRECAKPWPEADADVREAIDFLEYYAREARRPRRRAASSCRCPASATRCATRPRGVVAVISPWNFPLAIPAGMTAAALATGNAVVLKPAEQSPGCALRARARPSQAAGVPPARSRSSPGSARRSARRWSATPASHSIAFTGSAAVGLEIVAAAAEVPAGPASREARDRRDGRQELRDRGRRRRPRRGRAGGGALGLRLRRAEVLGVRSGPRPRGDLGSAHDRLGGAVEALMVGQAESFGDRRPAR